MNARIKRRLRNCKRRIQRRLRKRQWAEQRRRLFQDRNIHYDLAAKTKGLRCAGLGVFQLLAQRLKLADALDARVHLLKRHVPYFESDHVLNLVYNLLAGGKTLNDLELLRNNETYLDVLGAQRIPDPTTAGDFLRRFEAADIDDLMDVINDKRLPVWQAAARRLLRPGRHRGRRHDRGDHREVQAGDGHLLQGPLGLPPAAGVAGQHPGGAVPGQPPRQPPQPRGRGRLPRPRGRAVPPGGLPPHPVPRRHRLHADGRAGPLGRDGIGFVFGIDAQPNLVALAQRLPERVWTKLQRPPGYTVATQPRERPADVKEEVVRRRGFRNVRLVSEQVAEFNYRPVACAEEYLVVVLRKQLAWERHGEVVEEETRYFFYITNRWAWSCAEVVAFANDRGNQENLIEQLKNGVRALRAPSNTLESNWAYMVIAALAWNLKAWLALVQPRTGYGRQLLVMEFRRFLEEVVLLPCQIVRGGPVSDLSVVAVEPVGGHVMESQ